MKTAEKLEITKEIDRIVHKYPRPDSSELFRSELEYLVEVVKKSLQKPTEEKPTEYHLVINKDIADDTTEYKSPDFLEDDNGKKYKKIKENCYEDI